MYKKCEETGSLLYHEMSQKKSRNSIFLRRRLKQMYDACLRKNIVEPIYYEIVRKEVYKSPYPSQLLLNCRPSALVVAVEIVGLKCPRTTGMYEERGGAGGI